MSTETTQNAERAALILALRALQRCSPNCTADHAWKPDDWRAQRAEAVSACAEALAANAGSEPVATVFTMEALTPGGGLKCHATLHKPLPAGTKLYTADQVLAMGRVPLTRLQLREAFYRDTACTLGGDVDLAEKVCRVVEKAHGIKQGGQHGAE